MRRCSSLRWVAETDFGVVDPRMAAEVISLAFLQCVLRGLQRSPVIATTALGSSGSGVYSANISCLVIPDGCIGLPTLAALLNRIPVVAVRDNTNQMRNDLDLLPWQPSQLLRVENYLEAAGVVAALRAGIAPWSVTRPLEPTLVDRPAGADPKTVPVVANRIDSPTVGSRHAPLA